MRHRPLDSLSRFPHLPWCVPAFFLASLTSSVIPRTARSVGDPWPIPKNLPPLYRKEGTPREPGGISSPQLHLPSSCTCFVSPVKPLRKTRCIWTRACNCVDSVLGKVHPSLR